MSRLPRHLIISLLCFLTLTSLALAESNRDPATLYKNTDLTVLDISERSYDGGNALAITLAVPLDPATDHGGYLNVSEKKGGKIDGAWVLSESGKTLYFPYALPSHVYRVTVYKGLTGINGRRLKTTASQEIKTRDMNPSVNFASQGIILPVTGSQGLPVVTVNVDAVDLNFHAIAQTDIPEFLAAWYSGQTKRLYELGSLTEKSTLAYSGRFQLSPPANKRRTINIPVHTIKPLQQPGMYMAVMQRPGTYSYESQATYYMVSDLGLHARSYAHQLDVYVNSIQTADGVGGVQLLMLDKKGVILQETTTSPEGVATFAAPYTEGRVILAQKGRQTSILNLKSPALDLSEFNLGDRPQRKIETFFYSPRDLYRPGETVEINMLIRSGDGELLPSFPIPVKIKRPDGQVVKEFLWQNQQATGYYQYQFKLPKTAQTGQWQYSVTPSGTDEQSYAFKVEDFLPERMSLSYEHSALDSRFVNPTKPISIPVKGMYLYGAPAAGNRMSGAISYKQNRTPLPQFKGFEFGDADLFPSWARYELDDINLDGKGHGKFIVQSKWHRTTSPLTIRLAGSLFESGGRPVSRTISYTVWPKENLIGVRPLFAKQELENNSIAEFELILTNSNGVRQQASEIEVKLIREDRDYFWFFDDGRGWQSRYNEKSYTAFSQTVQIKKKGQNKVRFPVENGHYRLVVQNPATGAITTSRFHAGYSWWWYNTDSGNGATRPDVVSLVLDKQQYNPGDTAQLTIIPPHAGKGFVLVESDEPLWFMPIDLPKEGGTIAIPIDPQWNSHNLYISAMVLRPQDARSKRTVNRAMGLTHLKLDRSKRALNIAIEAPVQMRPETSAPFRFKITDADHKATTDVMLTVAAVDVGVLNITDFKTPDPLAWFFDQRRYTIDSHDLYGKVIESFSGEHARLRFGGDEDLSRGGKQPMTEVQIISLFTGPVQIDKQGIATVNLTIPDFNGRLRIMAMAFSGDRFGSSDAETTVAAPIIAEISLPRFLAPNDTSQAVIDVQNMTEKNQDLTWSLSATTPLTIQKKDYKNPLPPGKKSIRTIPFQVAGYSPQSTLRLTLHNEESGSAKIDLNRQWKIGIRPAYPATTKRFNATLHKGEAIKLDPADYEELIQDTVEASVMISSSPRLELQHHLKKLLHYPYGCLEQSTSAALPFLLVNDANLEQLGITDWDQPKRSEAVETGLQQIATKQRPNGSFGLWSNNGPEEEYLSAYASHFMLLAKSKGYIVADAVLAQSMNRLKYYLRNGRSMSNRFSEEPSHYTMAYRSYAGYVLSLTKRANLSSLRTLYDNHKHDAKSGLPLVHLGIALKNMGDHKRGDAAIQIGITRTRSDQYLGDYGSPFRDTALIISLLHTHHIQSKQADHLLFELADTLRNKRYLSTQERIALLQAGLPQLDKTAIPWQGNLAFKTKQHLDTNKDYQRLFTMSELQEGLSFTSESSIPLYATILLSGYPAKPLHPMTNRVEIARTYYNVQGKEIDLSQVTTGDLIMVSLAVRSKERLADLMVVDLLPAGLELENPNLIHTMNMNEMKIDDIPVPQLLQRTTIKHQEFRDDRFMAAIDQSSHRLSYLFYLARAVTPGRYSVPPPLAEDMYRPDIRSIGAATERLVVQGK